MDWLLSAQNDVARLPMLLWQQWWLSTGWTVIIAWLGGWSVSRVTSRRDTKLVVAVALALWVLLPGSWGSAYWLGLAFQAPSVITVLLCGLLCVRMFFIPAHAAQLHRTRPLHLLFLVLCGVTLGWVLLLDTLGVWPGSFYNWGFSAAAPAVAIGIASAPWIIAKNIFPSIGVVMVALASFFFLAFRLPTGNLFDALLDPWLWLYLQFALIQQWRHRA